MYVRLEKVGGGGAGVRVQCSGVVHFFTLFSTFTSHISRAGNFQKKDRFIELRNHPSFIDVFFAFSGPQFTYPIRNDDVGELKATPAWTPHNQTRGP